MQEAYRNAVNDPESSFVFDNTALAASLERIYRKKFNPKKEVDRGLFDAILATVNQATEVGFTEVAGDRDQDFLQALKTNNNVFAAFKTHRMQNDIAGQLVDEDGQLKSFARFKEDTKEMTGKYVDRWLRTEYDTAVIRAHQAADWQQFLREKDILPNLRWNESTSPEPRHSHMLFWNRIWSIDDPFWNLHRPGDQWNCKCSLSATDEPPTDNSDLQIDDPPTPGLGGNPGVTAKIFSDDHPYMKNAHKGAKRAVNDLLKAVQSEVEFNDRKYKSGGMIQTPKDFQQNSAEEKINLRAYTELAKLHGERYRLLSVINEQNRKNPDALNLRTGDYSDVKNPLTADGRNAIQNSIKSASRQQVSEVYIFLDKDYPMAEIYDGLRIAFQPGRAKTIKSIIIRFNSGELKRYDADRLREVMRKR